MHICFEEYTFEGNAEHGDGCAHNLIDSTGMGISIGEYHDGSLNAVPGVSEQDAATALLAEEPSTIRGFIQANGEYDDTNTFRTMDWSTFLWKLHKYKEEKGIKP